MNILRIDVRSLREPCCHASELPYSISHLSTAYKLAHHVKPKKKADEKTHLYMQIICNFAVPYNIISHSGKSAVFQLTCLGVK